MSRQAPIPQGNHACSSVWKSLVHCKSESSKSSAGTRAKEASMVHMHSKARGWKLFYMVSQHDKSGGSLAHLPAFLEVDWEKGLEESPSWHCILLHYGICILWSNGRRSLFLVYYFKVLIFLDIFITHYQFSRLQNCIFISSDLLPLSFSVIWCFSISDWSLHFATKTGRDFSQYCLLYWL